MPDVMKLPHEPQLVACSTASQAWNIAESREPPVPLPPFLTQAASAAALASNSAPANTRVGSTARTNLPMVSPSKRQKATSWGEIARDRCPCTLSRPALSGAGEAIFQAPWPAGDG